ncbi:MAG TPA: DUF4845 domain-containing protein [Solimonas sp.]|nr:DUF4845 domain-containing protein [Solimonas sp.]
MRTMRHQRGLGWFGLLFVLAVIGFVAIVVVKTLPMYLNQMKVASGVHATATDPENAKADVHNLRRELQKYWDINDVDYLTVSEIDVKRTNTGRFLSYDYEAREHLFYNIYIVIEFADDVPLANVQS